MRLYYDDINITADVDITKCVYHDVCGNRCDSLEIEMNDAAAWYGWSPKIDDVIEVEHEGFQTGTMYINTFAPENGRFKLIATSVPCASRRKGNAVYEQKTLEEIVNLCAAECKMGSKLFGLDGSMYFECVVREHESACGFLSRILAREGAVLKACNGRLSAISIEYAQELDAGFALSVRADGRNARHTKKDEARLARVEIVTPYGRGSARDASCTWGCSQRYGDEYPARNNAEAVRWAHGLLLTANRQCEELCMDKMEFDGRLTAMARVDVDSVTDVAGNWIVDEVEHDLFKGKSSVRLLRCLRLAM